MQKANGLIAILLIAAILLLPIKDSPENGLVSVSPQAVSGDIAAQNDSVSNEDNESGTVKIIAAVIIVLIVIISCITETDGQEVKAGWK